jgi:hypothetical protein
MPLSRITSPFQSSTANVYSPSANTVTIRTSAGDRLNVDSVGRVLIGANTIAGGTSNAHLQITQNTIAGLSMTTLVPVLSTGSIAGIDGYCFDGANTVVAGTINIRSTETWNVTNHGSAIQFRVTPTGAGQSLVESGRISSTGNYVLKGGTLEPGGVGITFPSTQVASTDPNTLDDYEEGTWTPVFATSGTQPTVSYITQNGTYIKIGRFVYVTFFMQVNTVSSQGTGNIRIGGMPFAQLDNTANENGAVFYQAQAFGFSSLNTLTGRGISSTQILMSNLDTDGETYTLSTGGLKTGYIGGSFIFQAV